LILDLDAKRLAYPMIGLTSRPNKPLAEKEIGGALGNGIDQGVLY
jgi:hypothetical protein